MPVALLYNSAGLGLREVKKRAYGYNAEVNSYRIERSGIITCAKKFESRDTIVFRVMYLAFRVRRISGIGATGSGDLV